MNRTSAAKTAARRVAQWRRKSIVISIVDAHKTRKLQLSANLSRGGEMPKAMLLRFPAVMDHRPHISYLRLHFVARFPTAGLLLSSTSFPRSQNRDLGHPKAVRQPAVRDLVLQILEDPESSPGDRNIYQATEESVINSRRMRRFDHLQQ